MSRSAGVSVSVVMPALNAARSITVALESLFAQTHGTVEVIVLDIESTDETAECVRDWSGRVRYLRHPAGCLASALNRAIATTHGTYVAFLDAHDAWLPQKLEHQLTYFEQFPSTGLLFGPAIRSRLASATLLDTADEVPVAANH